MVHSLRDMSLEEGVVPLLVVSPKHGSVEYKWEKKRQWMDDCNLMKVPSYTFLIYVDTAAQYRCTVESTTIEFNVKG